MVGSTVPEYECSGPFSMSRVTVNARYWAVWYIAKEQKMVIVVAALRQLCICKDARLGTSVCLQLL